MSKIQNISTETKKVSIYLDQISIYLDQISITYKYLKKSRFVSICLESLDDLDKNLNTSLCVSLTTPFLVSWG